MNEPVSRVTRSKVEARNNYNRLSRWYDLISGSTEEKYRQMGIQILDAQLGEKILEVGFGTGQVLVELAQLTGPTGLVYGVDLSDGMLSVAQGKIQKAGVVDRTCLSIADAAHLPFQGDYFDAVFMSFTLELIDTPEISRVLSECGRVLCSRGRLALVTMAKSAQPNFPERIYEWFHAKMPVAVDCRPIYAQVELKESEFKVDRVRNETMWGLPVEIISATKK